jgi:hypothetical protein
MREDRQLLAIAALQNVAVSIEEPKNPEIALLDHRGRMLRRGRARRATW